ncbi:hypothetical protein JK636_22565 [Clostridium sp. YIM B02515]|uniref:Uncharacterized protein n=1 Tax=Clostridium rhizosphaerae TaxID=2803861 RepID=A0ABS1TGJ2_9CLOT|nr:hypothetical protein [Clostridium rhizosphaerae]MBL4938491.1 hypothetical protein [Clostridium rhizosphaerae]
MNIDDLYITNYREAGGLPLHSITRLTKEEAYALASKLSQASLSKRDRYGDYFDTYYHKRLRTEEWLYNEFTSLKGEPQTHHPIYFTLLESERLHSFFGNDNNVKILLKDIEASHISFTPRDSMHLMDMGRTENTVWRKEDLFRLINESKQDILQFIRSTPEKYGLVGGYIEVQLWNDIYF